MHTNSLAIIRHPTIHFHQKLNVYELNTPIFYYFLP